MLFYKQKIGQHDKEKDFQSFKKSMLLKCVFQKSVIGPSG